MLSWIKSYLYLITISFLSNKIVETWKKVFNPVSKFIIIFQSLKSPGQDLKGVRGVYFYLHRSILLLSKL